MPKYMIINSALCPCIWSSALHYTQVYDHQLCTIPNYMIINSALYPNIWSSTLHNNQVYNHQLCTILKYMIIYSAQYQSILLSTLHNPQVYDCQPCTISKCMIVNPAQYPSKSSRWSNKTQVRAVVAVLKPNLWHCIWRDPFTVATVNIHDGFISHTSQHIIRQHNSSQHICRQHSSSHVFSIVIYTMRE